MRWPDPAAGPAQLANRALADQAWAHEQLAPFAGRTFALRIGIVSGAWTVTEDGGFTSAAADSPIDLRLDVSPLAVPAFLADPARWNEYVREDGDAALGGTLKDIARALPWLVEEGFAKAFGPVAGQRIADTGRHLLAFPEYATRKLGDSAGGYVRDELRLMVRGSEARALRDDIAAVAERVDSLAARIDALALDPR
ncbi:MAG: hypothetical protein IT522_14205 [Burkholderiales bacterium]|nr:hypothetical protein [Burkholderiales bacterium]